MVAERDLLNDQNDTFCVLNRFQAKPINLTEMILFGLEGTFDRLKVNSYGYGASNNCFDQTSKADHRRVEKTKMCANL